MTAYIVDKQGKCPHCGYKLDACSSADPAEDIAPGPGDVGVCIMCAGIIVYADRWTIRAPTPEEEEQALANLEVQRVRRAVKQLHGD